MKIFRKILFKNILKKIFFKTFFIFLFSNLSIIIIICFYYYNKIDDSSLSYEKKLNNSYLFLDKNGKKYFELKSENKNSFNSRNLNSNLVDAIIAVEDKSFFNHYGISFKGILGAIFINLSEGRGPFSGHGGSTITQQVSKLICMLEKEKKNEQFCRRQSIIRKLHEAIFSIALELKFNKDEILNYYVNNVYLGNGNIGFEQASLNYFNKSTNEISTSELAMLVGLLKAPSKYSPTKNITISQERSKIILKIMLEEKVISKMQFNFSINNLAKLNNNFRSIGKDYAYWIKTISDKKLKTIHEKIVLYTFFDPIVQRAVEDSVKKIFSKYVFSSSAAEVAVVVMKKNGKVSAILGGRKNRFNDNFNRSIQAFRQPGSAFKPLVFATALEKGFNPNDMFLDQKKIFTLKNGSKYSPKNYNDNYRGKVSLVDSLVHSINTITVEIAQKVKMENIIKMADDFGIKSKINENLASSLGTSEVNLLELTSVYNGFLNNGYKVEPKGLSEIKFSDSKKFVFNDELKKIRVMSNGNATELNKILVKVVKNGTGNEAQIKNWQIAGKTGTTQRLKDAWFIGYTSEYVIGIWIGNDDNSSLKKVSGGSLPARIWKEIALKIHQTPPKNFIKIENVDDINYDIHKKSNYENKQNKDSNIKSFMKNIFNFFK